MYQFIWERTVASSSCFSDGKAGLHRHHMLWYRDSTAMVGQMVIVFADPARFSEECRISSVVRGSNPLTEDGGKYYSLTHSNAFPLYFLSKKLRISSRFVGGNLGELQ
jgi:hypothetical protein